MQSSVPATRAQNNSLTNTHFLSLCFSRSFSPCLPLSLSLPLSCSHSLAPPPSLPHFKNTQANLSARKYGAEPLIHKHAHSLSLSLSRSLSIPRSLSISLDSLLAPPRSRTLSLFHTLFLSPPPSFPYKTDSLAPTHTLSLLPSLSHFSKHTPASVPATRAQNHSTAEVSSALAHIVSHSLT